MKNLHLIRMEKFTKPVIEFICGNFNKSDHSFIVIDKAKTSNYIEGYKGEMKTAAFVEDNENVELVPRRVTSFFKIAREMNKYDYIYIHQLANRAVILSLFLQPWLLKRCCWYIWGADLYIYENRNSSINRRIMEFTRKPLIRNMDSIVSYARGDYELARKWYGAKGRYYQAFYLSPIKRSYLDKAKNMPKEDTDYINVQIGNSAWPTNNHIQIIDALRKYSKNNIRVYAPLSYGLNEHAKKVAEYGKEAFGEKFIPMYEYLQSEEYAKFLASIDIVVFAHERQQAIGNTTALAYLGKKIYMRNDVSTWGLLKDDLKLDIYNVLDIENESYESFISGINNLDNSEKAKKTFDYEYIAEQWRHVFEDNEANR